MTQRKLELPVPSTDVFELALTQTDGQRTVFRDSGALMMSDLAGHRKRLIFKPKERVVENSTVWREFS